MSVSRRVIGAQGQCYDRGVSIMECSNPTSGSIGCSVDYLSGLVLPS